MTPAGKHGDQVFCNSPSDQEHLEYFVSEDRPQLFHLQGRSDPEHALPVEASVRHQDMAVGIESEEVAEGLDGDDGAGDGILLRQPPPEERASGIPRRSDSDRKEDSGSPIRSRTGSEKVTAEDFRDAEDDMSVGNLPEHVGTEPFPEFHHPLLMAGGAEACPRENGGDGACRRSQKIFMVAILALYPGKAVVQVATVQVAVNDLLEVRPPKSVRPFELLLVDLNKGIPKRLFRNAGQFL